MCIFALNDTAPDDIVVCQTLNLNLNISHFYIILTYDNFKCFENCTSRDRYSHLYNTILLYRVGVLCRMNASFAAVFVH